jgi:ABC-type molybdate transport system substrate-binding protein
MQFSLVLLRAARPLRFLASVALGCGLALAAAAEDVRVFTASAFQPVVAAVGPAFEKRTGSKLVVVSGTAEAMAERIRSGESFDLAVLPPPLLEALGRDGAVSDGSITLLARDAPGAKAGGSYAGAVSANSSNSQPALSLLILLASEETQPALRRSGLSAP